MKHFKMPPTIVSRHTSRASQFPDMAPKRNKIAGDDATAPAAKRPRPHSPNSAPTSLAASRAADAELVERKFPKREHEKSKGMFNPGALCYRNASLQALFHSPPFYHFLATVHQQCDEQAGTCVLCALQELLYRYFNSPGTNSKGGGGTVEVSRRMLKSFTAACKQHLPQDVDGAREIAEDLQSDAFMFIDYLIRERIAKTEGMNETLLAEFFEVGIEERWKCRHCGEAHKKSIKTPQLGLVAELIEKDKTHNVAWCLNNRYFYEKLALWCESGECEILRAKMEAKGPNVKAPNRMFKRLITRAPEVLVLRISRFAFAKVAPFDVKKVFDRVEVPEFLNFNPYRHEDLQDDCVYRLDGAVGHKGEGPSFGHYLAAVRNEAGRYEVIEDTKEILRSDDFGTMATFNETVDGEGAEFDSYVLVYSKH
ncbi:hypothetical protein BST61_g760 [Cercospora zeina]